MVFRGDDTLDLWRVEKPAAREKDDHEIRSSVISPTIRCYEDGSTK